MRTAFEKKLIKNARQMGLVIIALGANGSRPLGLFERNACVREVARRVMATHPRTQSTYVAAKSYARGYKEMLDNFDMKARAFSPDLCRRIQQIELTLEARFLDGLLTAYSRAAQLQSERLKMERERRSREKEARKACVRVGKDRGVRQPTLQLIT